MLLQVNEPEHLQVTFWMIWWSKCWTDHCKFYVIKLFHVCELSQLNALTSHDCVSFHSKLDMLNLVTYLNYTPIFE